MRLLRLLLPVVAAATLLTFLYAANTHSLTTGRFSATNARLTSPPPPFVVASSAAPHPPAPPHPPPIARISPEKSPSPPPLPPLSPLPSMRPKPLPPQPLQLSPPSLLLPHPPQLAAAVAATTASTTHEDPAARLVPTSQCLRGGGRDDGAMSLDVLVLILSSQQQSLQPARRRQAVRRSWAFSSANLGAAASPALQRCAVRHLFVVGGAADAASPTTAAASTAPHLGSGDEADVLTLPVDDTYRHITAKVLAALRWATAHARFRYLLKTDDDSFLCVSRLLELLRTLPRTSLYLGVANAAHKVIGATGRTLYERWRDPEYIAIFNRSVYAPYMQGAGYVLSYDAAALVVARAAALPRLTNIEDALVGTLLEGAAPTTSRPHAFRHRNRDDYAVSVCAHDTEFVLLHKLSEDELATCRAATQRRRSAACPGGPCVCRNLGRRVKRKRTVLAWTPVGSNATYKVLTAGTPTA